MYLLRSFNSPLACAFGSRPMVLTFAMYLACVVVLAATVAAVCRLARYLRVPAVITGCTVSGFLLYAAMVIPGALGLLTPIPVLLTFIGVSGLVRWAAAWRSISSARDTSVSAVAFVADWRGWHLVMLALGTLAIAPLLSFFAAAPLLIVSRGWPLAWDTVSYHLPSLVEYLQQCSLWIVDEPYQSYSFGFELIGGFPAVFAPSHSGFMVAHVYAVIFVVAAIVGLANCVAGGASRVDSDVPLQFVPLMSLAVWCLIFHEELWAIGKNDIFQAACILSMFGLLLADSAEGAYLRRLLAGGALALAIATKPTSFAYVPIFVVLCFRELRSSVPRISPRTFRCAVTVLLVVSAGGFFYIRNLAMLGNIVDSRLVAVSMQTSLIANLSNPRLYASKIEVCLLLLASCLPLSLYFLRVLPRTPWIESNRFVLLAFHMTGLAAIVITPWFVLQPDAMSPLRWEFRLAMPFFTFSAIVCSLAMGQRLRKSTHLLRLPHGLPVLAAALLAFLPWWWHDRTPRGLPGFDNAEGRPRTGIYRWVQQIHDPIRIYAAGLFPYGLYGAGWANRLVYDLSSAKVAGDEGRQRIKSILGSFRPDVVVIAADAFSPGPFRPKPAIVDWLRQQGELVEVYCDATASAFEVLRGTSRLPVDMAACRVQSTRP